MNYILLLGMPGGGELIFIVLIIIMLFGSKKIPELARGLGKGMREIKNATNDIQQEIREGAREVNNAKNFTNVEKQVNDMIHEEKDSTPQEQRKESEPIKSEGPEIKPVEHPGAVQRKSPYESPEKDDSGIDTEEK